MGKSDFSALIGKAKEKQIKTPVQKVVPIKEKRRNFIFFIYSIR